MFELGLKHQLKQRAGNCFSHSCLSGTDLCFSGINELLVHIALIMDSMVLTFDEPKSKAKWLFHSHVDLVHTARRKRSVAWVWANYLLTNAWVQVWPFSAVLVSQSQTPWAKWMSIWSDFIESKSDQINELICVGCLFTSCRLELVVL